MSNVETVNLQDSNLAKNLLSHDLVHNPDIIATQILQKLHWSTISNPAQLLQQLLNFDVSDQQELQSIIQEADWSFVEIVAAYLHNQRVVAFDNEAASSNKQNVYRVLTQQHAQCLQELEDILESESQAQKNRGVMRNLQKQKQQQQMQQEQFKTAGTKTLPAENLVHDRNLEPQDGSTLMNSANLYNSILENLYLQQQLQKTQQQNDYLQSQYSGNISLGEPPSQTTTKQRMSFDSATSGSVKPQPNLNHFDSQAPQMYDSKIQNIPQRTPSFMNQKGGLPNIKTGQQANFGTAHNDFTNSYAQARNQPQFPNLNYLNQAASNPLEPLKTGGTPLDSSKSHSFDNPYLQPQLKASPTADRRSLDVDLRSKQSQLNFQSLINSYRGSLDSGTVAANFNFSDNMLGSSLQTYVSQQNMLQAGELISQQQLQHDNISNLNQQVPNRLKMIYQNQLLSQIQNQGNQMSFNSQDMQQQMMNQQNNYLQQLQRSQQQNQNVNSAYMSSFYNPTNYGNQNT